MLNVESLPMSGTFVLGALAWGAISALALGPMVADRTIQKSGWNEHCVQELLAQQNAQRPRPSSTPQLSCEAFSGVLDSLVGHGAGTELCGSGLGDFIDESIDLAQTYDPVTRARDASNAMKSDRITAAAELAPDRCSCAQNVVAQDRLDWGLYAGSLRFASQPNDLTARLTQALHSPACSFKLEELG